MKNLFQKNDRVFPHPFSLAYWKTAASELNNLKIIVLASMLIALASVLGTLQIYITPLIRVQISFLITGLGAMIYGPVIAMIGGVISDIVTYLLFASGPFFPGYTLSALLAGLVFALFLYRTKISPLRIIAPKFIINVFINTLLGSLWRVVMGSTGSKGYSIYVATSGIKNLLLLPLEVTLLTLIIGAVIPFLSKKKIIPKIEGVKLTPTFVIVSLILSAASLAAFIYCRYNLPIFTK
ncbi:MAG: folate family ECF transporter S component [Clostridiales bacterium]|nr:folate family ECF transporter S component [Clostridiales bacterium]